MKYRMISLFVVGLLTTGLYAEAASVEARYGKQTEERTEETERIKGTGSTEQTGAGQELPLLYGGVLAQLRPGEAAAQMTAVMSGNFAVLSDAGSVSAVPADGASGEASAAPADGASGEGTAAPTDGASGEGTAALTDGASGEGTAALTDGASGEESADSAKAPAASAPASGEIPGNGGAVETGDTVPENAETVRESEYADLALADVTNYVNVRTEPNTESAVVGKIYDGAVAQILETTDGEDGEWFRIVSGNVEGYIKEEFFLYGEAAVNAIEEYVTRYAVVEADRLNVRKEPDVSSPRIGYVDRGEEVQLLENSGEWLKVQYTSAKAGYVAAEYVSIRETFAYAKTPEEEAAERAARKALEEREKVSEEAAAENTSVSVTPQSGTYADTSQLRSELVDYAMQFLGNRYVHGGNSLENGTDCSGFTSLIYAAFGYSLSRTPSGQLSDSGRSIDYSAAKPGDVICYGSEKCTHVALYIGDGQIIHAANARKGVIIGDATYDNILGVKNIID